MIDYIHEAQVKIATVDFFRDIGYICAFGPDISQDGPTYVRQDYTMVVLIGRTQKETKDINSNIPTDNKKFAQETGAYE